MTAKKDIQTEEDVQLLVHQFYAKVKRDDILSPIFYAAIKGSWEQHLLVMCGFWSSILLYTRKYLSDPMTKHLSLPLEKRHFNRWLLLFGETLDELFEGDTASLAKKRARAVAGLMMCAKDIE